MSKKLKLGFKIIFVTVLLYYLTKRGFLSIEETKKALFRFHFIIPAYLALLTAAILAVIRWNVLLSAQKIILPLGRVFQLGFIGNFFNIALPGAVSGDVVKAIYVAKEIHGNRAKAFGSILFDRVAGVSALVLVSLLALFLSLQAPWGHQLLTAIQLFVGVAGVVVLVFYAYLFIVKQSYDPLLMTFKALEKRFVPLGSLTRTYEGILTYRTHSRAVFISLGISTLIHLLVIFACYQFTLALGESHVPLLAITVVVPLGLLVTAVPLTPAGVGTGHAAFLALFHLIGSERGADVFNLFVLYSFIQGIFGGLIYLRFKSKISALPT